MYTRKKWASCNDEPTKSTCTSYISDRSYSKQTTQSQGDYVFYFKCLKRVLIKVNFSQAKSTPCDVFHVHIIRYWSLKNCWDDQGSNLHVIPDSLSPDYILVCVM